jgi:hypothetical protein
MFSHLIKLQIGIYSPFFSMTHTVAPSYQHAYCVFVCPPAPFQRVSLPHFTTPRKTAVHAKRLTVVVLSYIQFYFNVQTVLSVLFSFCCVIRHVPHSGLRINVCVCVCVCVLFSWCQSTHIFTFTCIIR